MLRRWWRWLTGIRVVYDVGHSLVTTDEAAAWRRYNRLQEAGRAPVMEIRCYRGPRLLSRGRYCHRCGRLVKVA